MAEAVLRGEAVGLDALQDEIHPAFIEHDGQKTDVVVLGCTHYPLIGELIAKSAPWDVTLIDPSDAIANRTEFILSRGQKPSGSRKATPGAVLTQADQQLANERTGRPSRLSAQPTSRQVSKQADRQPRNPTPREQAARARSQAQESNQQENTLEAPEQASEQTTQASTHKDRHSV